MEEDESVLNAIIIASVIGIIIVGALILFYPRPSEDFTALYFGNYTKTPADGFVSFDYTIENHENKDMSYNVSYLVDNSTGFSENVFVIKDGNKTTAVNVPVNETGKKISVLLNTSEEIHFWTA